MGCVAALGGRESKLYYSPLVRRGKKIDSRQSFEVQKNSWWLNQFAEWCLQEQGFVYLPAAFEKSVKTQMQDHSVVCSTTGAK